MQPPLAPVRTPHGGRRAPLTDPSYAGSAHGQPINPAHPRHANRRPASSSPTPPPLSTIARSCSQSACAGSPTGQNRSAQTPERLLHRAPVQPDPPPSLHFPGQLGAPGAGTLAPARPQHASTSGESFTGPRRPGRSSTSPTSPERSTPAHTTQNAARE
jgi:hypothetical protein